MKPGPPLPSARLRAAPAPPNWRVPCGVRAPGPKLGAPARSETSEQIFRQIAKERPPKRAPLSILHPEAAYFFSTHFFVASSHLPPAFSQSPDVLAVSTFWGKAGPVIAMAVAKATIETRALMRLILLCCWARRECKLKRCGGLLAVSYEEPSRSRAFNRRGSCASGAKSN